MMWLLGAPTRSYGVIELVQVRYQNKNLAEIINKPCLEVENHQFPEETINLDQAIDL